MYQEKIIYSKCELVIFIMKKQYPKLVNAASGVDLSEPDSDLASLAKQNIRYFCLIMILSWFLVSVVKLCLTQMVFFEHESTLKLLFSVLFWMIGTLIILLAAGRFGIPLDINTLVLCFLLLMSLINYKLITLVFALLVWCAIARLITLAEFRAIYLISILFLIAIILCTVKIVGQNYYHDGRYGAVASFGFANSNSFPQLLIILLLVFSCRLRWTLLLALSLFLVFLPVIKTRTFYIILLLYPLLLLIGKFGFPKWISGMVFLLTGTSLLLIFTLNLAWISELDKILSYRLSFSDELFDHFTGIKDYLFGSTSVAARSLSIPMDLSYIVVIFNYGIIAAIFIGWLYMKALDKLLIYRQYNQVALILCFLAYAFVENLLINYLLNPGLFYVFHAIYSVQYKR